MLSLVQKCHRVLQALPPLKRLVVGCSGGADSVCLALVLRELGYDLVLAHLNHSLRGKESDQDARFVRRLAKKWGVPCVTRKTIVLKKGNLEANARAVRYEFLESVRQEHKADAILVAHHRDDQVETIMMNLIRGAGLRGLRGMRFQQGRVIRPLLTVTKAEILAFLKTRNQPHREDRTNQDIGYLRNSIRRRFLPDRRKKEPTFEARLLRISKKAATAVHQYDRKAEKWLANHVSGDRFPRAAFSRLGSEFQGEILIRMLGPHNLYKKHINQLIQFIRNGKTGKRMTVKGMTFTIEYQTITFEQAPRFLPLFKGGIPKRVPGEGGQKRLTSKEIQWGEWRIENLSSTVIGDCKLKIHRKLEIENCCVRSWHSGDRFQPAGMKGTKKLQDFFVDAKIPKNERHRIPIIVNANNDIMAVGNLRWSELAIKARLDHVLTIQKA
ncbi:tRNA lysidine(34) synthetase TilS [Candidatus Peregrinibacteria bacterium]|nr:tRNA lysidine(34) synthetase TilS [Candidatus Peregrinibacteria bacterium]